MKVHKKLSDLLFRYLLFLFTIVTVIAVIMIGVYMFQSGGPSIAKVGIKNFLFGKTWDTSVEPAKYGILPFLLSSVFSMIGTVVITVPVSILVAVGMSHFIPRPVASVLRTVISMLAGIPSVIYGFLGMILLVPFVQNMFSLPAGLTLLSAIVVLIVMTLPTIISVSESSITAVPEEYMEASLALGVNREYTILHIIVPAAKSGILSAVLLGLGRAVGETMAVIMVAGNVAQMPKLLEPVRFLTTAIVTEMAYASEETSGVLMGIGLVLFVFIVVINGLFYALIKRTAAGKRLRKGDSRYGIKKQSADFLNFVSVCGNTAHGGGCLFGNWIDWLSLEKGTSLCQPCIFIFRAGHFDGFLWNQTDDYQYDLYGGTDIDFLYPVRNRFGNLFGGICQAGENCFGNTICN